MTLRAGGTWTGPIVAAALTGALVVGLGGCSGGDDEQGSDEPSDTTSSTTTVPTFDGDPDSQYCELSVALIDPELGDSSKEIREFYEQFDDGADQLLEVAPDEIADDVATFVDGVRSLREPLDAVDFDMEALDVEDVPVLTDPEFPTAGNRVVAYNAQVCAAEADGDPGTGSTAGDDGAGQRDGDAAT